MQQITSEQFKAAVALDPAWSSKLIEPMEVTDYCDMKDSDITHLSPLLHFTEINEAGDSANFWGCKSLKIAEGKFKGFVYFAHSGIEKIGDLTCGKDNNGKSAYFWHCASLKVAEGKFQGYVSFSYSSIEKIGDLSCGKDSWGTRFSIKACPNLKSIPTRFNSKEIQADEKLIEKLEVDRYVQKKREEIMEIII